VFLGRSTRWLERNLKLWVEDLKLWVEKERLSNELLSSPNPRMFRLNTMKRLHRKIWTPEEDNLLRTLLENGRSVTIAAETLTRTVTAVKGRASLLRISCKRNAGSKKPTLRDDPDAPA
jgi:hypothetical protein